jgi:hypothetical protein
MLHLTRLFVAVFFLIAVEFLCLIWAPPGWIALTSGAIGSIFLIIPPFRLEIWKAMRTRYRGRVAPTRSPDLQLLDDEVDERYTRKIEDHEDFDAIFLATGGVLLAFYFLFQVPYKLELVDHHELMEQIDKLRQEQIYQMRQMYLQR